MAEYAAEFKKLIDQEGLDQKTLPTDIKKSINGFGMLLARYDKTPTENMLAGVEKADLGIATAIVNYLEAEAGKASEAKAAEEEKLAKEKQAQEAEQQRLAAEKSEQERIAKEQQEAEKKRLAEEKAEQERIASEQKATEDKKPENRVKAKLKDGKISVSDLKEILGTLDTWSNEETVGSLKLKRSIYSDSNYYKQV